MDRHLRELLFAILESDPENPLDDEQREAAMYAMLALHPPEHLPAIAKFADSISSDFKRSHLLHKLAINAAQRLEFDFAEQTARTIPILYWRFSALNQIADELLRRAREVSNFKGASRSYDVRAQRLLAEIEQNLPSIPEDDGDRVSILWRAGVSLVGAGRLDWAESLASCTKYCSENTDIMLRSAKARAARGQTHQTVQLARRVAELARMGPVGPGEFTDRAFDLENAAELVLENGDQAEAQGYLEEAVRFGVDAQESHEIDGSKCLVAIATTAAKHGYLDMALRTAQKITHAARRESALQRIEEISSHG